MVSITLSVSEDVRMLMKKFPEVNWSGFVRHCITERAKKLELREEMLKQFEKEKGFSDWAVKTIRDGRRKR